MPQECLTPERFTPERFGRVQLTQYFFFTAASSISKRARAKRTHQPVQLTQYCLTPERVTPEPVTPERFTPQRFSPEPRSAKIKKTMWHEGLCKILEELADGPCKILERMWFVRPGFRRRLLSQEAFPSTPLN